MIFIAIISLIFIYLVDTFLVAVTYQALKLRFGWKISTKKSFIILLIIFAVLENYILPFLLAIDMRIIIGNEKIADFFDMHGTIHSIELFNPGLFEILLWSSQAFLAGIIGPKILNKN